jgi:tetratricopeptide (TPR) repeat protein
LTAENHRATVDALEVVMTRDERGLAVTNASDADLLALGGYAHAVLALGNGMPAIISAAGAAPDCPLLQACAASTFLYTQSLAAAAGAAPYLARAVERLADVSQRERIFIESVRAGLGGDFQRALAGYEEIAARWPRDVVAAKLAEFHFFETGETMRQLRVMRRAAEANPGVSHVLAMYAFALELTEMRDEAEHVARRALEIDPLTMWAQHCLAHVWSGQSRVDEGIAGMRSFAPTWEKFNHYTVAHNSFHLGALYLDNLAFDEVRDLYRTKIWGFQPEAVVEQTDSILLLWYTELAGGKVEAEWREIAPHIRGRVNEHVFPFLNAIYLYALARAGERETVAVAMAAIEQHADAQTGRLKKVWKEIGMPLMRGCVAFAQAEYDIAASELGPILPEVACVGGSDEQRGVFIQSHLVSLIRGGNREAARAAIEEYIAGRPITSLERHWISAA